MQSSLIAATKHVVLVGGGHTHALFLKKWGMRPLNGVNLTLINPNATAPYTGMLPGYIAGHYQKSELNIDLFKLTRFAGARLILGKATSICGSERIIELGPDRQIHYDIASIDIGISSNLHELDGFDEFGVPAKPLDQYSAAWDALLAKLRRAPTETNLLVIGSGIAGVELALAMSHRFEVENLPTPTISVLERSNEAMPTTNMRTRRKLLQETENRGIRILLNQEVNRIEKNAIYLNDGSKVPSDFTVSAAGARPYAWLEQTHLTLSEGFVDVDEFLKSTGDRNIYAVGDCANMIASPRPKAGVFAVRQAPVLFHNIRADLMGSRCKAYRPQKRYLKLISTGQKSAVADKSGLSISGPMVWSLKDRIDRKFMDQFENYPEMKQLEKEPGQRPAGSREVIELQEMCGACGAKVPASALARSLQMLEPPKNENVISGPGDDASVLKIGDSYQIISTDHLRAFTQDPWLLAKTAAIHALGDIWAMGGKPHSMLSTVTLPPSSERLQAETLKEIMSAIKDISSREGVDVIGGHTSVGAELSIGFTAIGFRDLPPLNQSGASADDVLILTKPIGSGVILAAEMAGKAEGKWVEEVYQHLIESSASASKILSEEANAMTDVTGFGLAGHLALMMRASNTSARLNCGAIPYLNGAKELAAMKIRSTLWPSNSKFVHEIDHRSTHQSDLLFDPQTSGGLLASVPRTKADSILSRLHEVAPASTKIGEVLSGPTAISLEE